MKGNLPRNGVGVNSAEPAPMTDRLDLRDAARRYQAKGFSVIPVGPNKRPLIRWEPYQHQRPRPEEIDEWWSRWPQANIGVVTGAISGIVVLDADAQHGGIASLHSLHTPATTWLARTGGGGLHQFFRHPGNGVRITNRAGLRPGLDVRGDGGYVVVAPSLHASGNRYQWLTPPARMPLAPLPESLLSLLTAPPATNGAAPDPAIPIPEGQRNDSLYRIARSLHAKGLSAPAIEAAVLAENQARCRPPLDEQEVRDIVRGAISQPDRADFAPPSTEGDDTPEAPSPLVDEADAELEDEPPPVLAEEALHGLVGHLVRAIDPGTEADPAIVAIHLLVGFGNLLGRNLGGRVERTDHPLALNALVVAPSAQGRKGAGWSTPKWILGQLDPEWAKNRIAPGLSTGEGLIHHVRDPIERDKKTKDPETGEIRVERVEVDPGEPDKRLLVMEPEFGVVLERMAQPGNTLSQIMREAWDGATLTTLIKTSSERATNAHVSTVGHITPYELLDKISHTSLADGFANRFLFFWSRRSKELPEGGGVDDETLRPLIAALHDVVIWAQAQGQRTIRRDPDAKALWAMVYSQLSRYGNDLVEVILKRREAQILRLSVLYAVLDRSLLITPVHLKAAFAVWDYSEATVRRVFGGRLGVTSAEKLLEALRTRGPLTRTQISQGIFSGRRTARQINADLEFLKERGLVHSSPRASAGRDAEVWEAVGDAPLLSLSSLLRRGGRGSWLDRLKKAEAVREKRKAGANSSILKEAGFQQAPCEESKKAKEGGASEADQPKSSTAPPAPSVRVFHPFSPEAWNQWRKASGRGVADETSHAGDDDPSLFPGAETPRQPHPPWLAQMARDAQAMRTRF